VDALLNKAPPDTAEYQFIVSPAPAVADNVTLPVPQFDAPVPVGVDGNGLIVAVTITRDAEIQPDVVFLACA